ncbi:MAG: L-seryl-tRNA(Sec) selenium transferase [Candidatus Neomarinimicrobiota bacterium]
MRKTIRNNLTRLPAVQKVIEYLAQTSPKIKPVYLTGLVRAELNAMRAAIQNGDFKIPTDSDLVKIVAEKVTARIANLTGGRLKKVINATGIVLHTGLGRAPFGCESSQALADLLSGYVNLEFDLNSGERGERLDLIDEHLRLISGAESSAVVNNNAAAVLLALNTLAEGKEVIISRGELIEIGGSFRLPDIMQKSGVRMVEIGTTNRTHLQDYQDARTRRTGAILLAHSSNYKIEGFTTKPEAGEIITWAHTHRLPVIIDLGSGALFPMEKGNLPYEPVVAEVVKQGFDVVTFSGDKLLGGPQAGLLVGKKIWIDRIRKNPLMRVLRCDKTVFTLLERTLNRYLTDVAVPEIATYQLLTASPALLKERAVAIISALDPAIIKILNLNVRDSVTEAGSGAMPIAAIPSVALVAIPQNVSEAQLAGLFRSYSPPVIGYCKNGEFWLDLKAIPPVDLPLLQSALQAIGRSLLPKT